MLKREVASATSRFGRAFFTGPELRLATQLKMVDYALRLLSSFFSFCSTAKKASLTAT